MCELIQQVGVEGCGGETDGVNALSEAKRAQHLDVMAKLMDAGVALGTASDEESERTVKQAPVAGGRTNLLVELDTVVVDNKHGPRDFTPLLVSIATCRPSARRIVRLLIEAGADTSATFQNNSGMPRDTPWFNDTALVYCLREKKVGGEDATATK